MDISDVLREAGQLRFSRQKTGSKWRSIFLKREDVDVLITDVGLPDRSGEGARQKDARGNVNNDSAAGGSFATGRRPSKPLLADLETAKF